MKKLLTAITFLITSATIISGRQFQLLNDNLNTSLQQDSSTTFLTIQETVEKGDLLTNKIVYIKGKIDHVCKHSKKRFKVVDLNEDYGMRVELGKNFDPVDSTIVGKNVKVTGTLVPSYMNKEQVKQWEDNIKKVHKGEEDTEHYKEEIAFVQSIYQDIVSGKIPHYTTYSLNAESYVIEK